MPAALWPPTPRRGQGPVRIAADLRRDGVPAELIAAVLAEAGDWVALARKVRQAQIRSRSAHAVGGEGAASTFFAVSWLFIGSYPRGHWRRFDLD